MPLSDTNIALAVRSTLLKSFDLAAGTIPLQFTRGFSLDSGTGANQADRVWHDTRTIAISGTDDLDLSGVLVDAFGDAATFVKVKGIFVSAAAANTNNVVVGNAAATQFLGPFGAAAHTAHVRPGGFLAFACSDGTGWGVVNAASDLLRVANSGAGTSVTYDIVIIGTSA
jgi:hypothetical protein